MSHIITRIQPAVERNWIKELAEAITDPSELLQLLEISPEEWTSGFAARRLFSQRVPRSFVARMEKGNPNDPLLKQVLPIAQEFNGGRRASALIRLKSKIMRFLGYCINTTTAYY